MKKTVIFGGTFNPAHEGHKNLLTQVMARGFDEAIVIPDKIPPHKSTNASFEERFDGVKKLFADMPNVTVSDIENRREGKSYTYDTLTELKALYPDKKLYFLMGSDMFLGLEKWYRAGDILNSTPIIACARTRDDFKKITEYKNILEKKYNCDIIIYDINIIELSSTQLRSELVRKIDAHNKANLSEKRYNHVMSVAKYAVYLSSFHGIDAYDAYVGAIAHDCTKYLDDDEQLQYFEKNNIKLSQNDLDSPKIWHQISGAHFAKTVLGIENEDILNSVRYHTTGRKGMSNLEKLVCLADSIEPTRDYEGVEKMRKCAKTSLDKALLLSFDRLIEYVKQRGLTMNNTTLEARDYLREEIENGNSTNA